MAADSLRAVPRHDSDDERSADGNKNAVPAQVISRGGNQRRAPAAEIKHVRKKPDQTQERQRDKGTDCADHHSQGGDRQHAERGRKIP